jgi:hypothetical protein
MPAQITRERPDSADAIALITELEAQLEPHYPRASRHGYVLSSCLLRASPFSSSAQTEHQLAAAAFNWLAPSMGSSSACTCVGSFADQDLASC